MTAEPGDEASGPPPTVGAGGERPRRPRRVATRPRSGGDRSTPGAPPVQHPPGLAPARRDGGRARARVPHGPAPHRRLIETSGPDPATPLDQVRLVIGAIVGAHGLRGEAKLRLMSDDPEHLQTVSRIWLGAEERPRRVLGIRFHGGQALVRLAGVTTPEQVDTLRGLEVRIAGNEARPNDEGEYFLFQLIGLRAYDEAGALLGTLTDIMETGAQDVFVVTPEQGPELLLPNHPQYVLDIQPEAGRLIVRPPVYVEPPPAKPADRN